MSLSHNMHNHHLHKFHIPVMGLAYTIDTPVKVAQYGISSVIPIGEDRLIEMMRKYYCQKNNQPYIPITSKEDDYRAKRITSYLNLVNKIVQDQINKLKNSAFEKGSELVKYFEMLPDDNKLKLLYNKMLTTSENKIKEEIAIYLRSAIQPGSIDVNILTKTDRNNYNANGELIEDGSDAVSALRGYAQSNLSNSAIVFSAGMNPRLYNYLEKLPQFELNEKSQFDKRVIIKVSDYRSAIIQGKYLAKKGIWVSEFRIESGLNCGGHAFATDGYLMGPILEEFKNKKQELIDTIFEIYSNILFTKSGIKPLFPPLVEISAQGGIGTNQEDIFLHNYYGITSTGWGTPFLLVPEATTVDEPTLKLLCKAKKEDVILSHNSPLGVRFHYLKGTSAELEKLKRIKKGKPGSPCTEKHLAFNTEFTSEPICTASHAYQKLKIAELESLMLPEKNHSTQLTKILDKECLCIGLSNAASNKYEIPFIKNLKAVNVCPGPNIAYFTKEVSLQKMVDHIYGRTNIIEESNRPHMFIKELELYINYLKELLESENSELDLKKRKYNFEFYQNLMNGISYYRQLPHLMFCEKVTFLKSLNDAENELFGLNYQYSISE